MTEEEARLISENAPQGFHHRVETGQKVILLTGLKNGKYNKSLANQHRKDIFRSSLCIQLALNFVAQKDPITIPFGVVLSDAFSVRLRDVYEFDLWGDTLSLRRMKYRIARGINRDEIKKLHEISMEGLRTYP
jgi:hypothetical protein